MVLKVSEQGTEVEKMITDGGNGNENVSYVCEDAINTPEYTVHEILKCLSCFSESEGHPEKLI